MQRTVDWPKGVHVDLRFTKGDEKRFHAVMRTMPESRDHSGAVFQGSGCDEQSIELHCAVEKHLEHMKALIVTLFLIFACASLEARKPVWQPLPGHTQLPIWPSTPPDAHFGPPPNTETMPETGEVDKVSRPTMTVYSPKEKNTGVAVVVFPGGGYSVLAIDLEGTEVCNWLTSKGITCVLLKYRVPNTGPHWDGRCKCQVNPKAPMALEDAQRTMGLLRFRAAEYHVDPRKIGVLGFSAGGHLVADISTHFQKRLYQAVDAADQSKLPPRFRRGALSGTSLDFQ